jgi:hypothetical protein
MKFLPFVEARPPSCNPNLPLPLPCPLPRQAPSPSCVGPSSSPSMCIVATSPLRRPRPLPLDSRPRPLYPTAPASTSSPTIATRPRPRADCLDTLSHPKSSASSQLSDVDPCSRLPAKPRPCPNMAIPSNLRHKFLLVSENWAHKKKK